MSEDCGQPAAPAPVRPLQSPGPGQSSEVRGPAHTTDTQHRDTSGHTSPQPPVVSSTLSPVTSSRSLSPLTRHKARGRVPGFPQRVTQASSASVNNVSEPRERRDRGHYTVDTQSGVTAESVQSPPSPDNNLSRGLLGRTLFTEREREWTFVARKCIHVHFFFSCNKDPLIDVA